jgi:hypothetical protein
LILPPQTILLSGQLWEAIKANLLSYFAGFVMFLIFIIYMLATKGSAKTVHFLAFMMAMGNTYGVVLIILLMGNGLVALPRRLWRKGDSKHELTRLYVMVFDSLFLLFFSSCSETYSSSSPLPVCRQSLWNHLFTMPDLN